MKFMSQADLLLAKGAARITSAALRRAEDVATVRREVHVGPREGQFAKCAEKHTRPLVDQIIFDVTLSMSDRIS